MTMANGERTYQLKALTDLWTGSVTLEEKNHQIKGKTGPDRLITTGLLGSIRWWFEVLVRGLGGSACDPSETKCEHQKHCVVCELFGCTGYARKFRFEVLDEKGNTKKNQINKDQTFILRFTPLRPICDEEFALLDATMRLIANYGAIGGKIVFKPTDEADRIGEIHHIDYGIVRVEKVDPLLISSKVTDVKEYICKSEKRCRELDSRNNEKEDFSWASLKHFWFVDNKTLSRGSTSSSSFNKVLGRKESKECVDCGQVHDPSQKCPTTKRHPRRESEQLVNSKDEISRWLAGSQQESKKVFSFKNPARTFGFVKPGLIDFEAMKERLKKAWGQNDWSFLTGDKIIDQLFSGKEESS